jgi:diketogulonate reductase-like aldo/keto reductase
MYAHVKQKHCFITVQAWQKWWESSSFLMTCQNLLKKVSSRDYLEVVYVPWTEKNCVS